MTMFIINSKLRLTAALVLIHVTVGVQGFNVKLQIYCMLKKCIVIKVRFKFMLSASFLHSSASLLIAITTSIPYR